MNINRLWGGYTFKLKPRVCCMGPNAMWGWSVGVKPHTYTQGVVIATAGSQKKLYRTYFFILNKQQVANPLYIYVYVCVFPFTHTEGVFRNVCVCVIVLFLFFDPF